MKNVFNNDETKWLMEYYPTMGKNKCAQYLNKSPQQIKSKIDILRRDKNITLNLTHEKKTDVLNNRVWKEKQYYEYKVNPEQFINIKTPEVAYILGIIWADGYLYIRKTKHSSINEVRLTIVKDDFENIRHVFMKTGKWATPTYQQKDRREQVHCVTSNKPFAEFLLSNDYESKTYLSADKILSKIPDHLKHYWFRGLIDGDGCFTFGKSYKFSVCSAYEQDWTYMETLLKSLDIKYSIYKTIVHNGNKFSTINICNKKDIIKMGDYIFNGYETDNIGFQRKYQKYKSLF